MSDILLPDWVRFNLGAYAKDTGHLTTLQHGAYHLLMWAYYARGMLPKDDRTLATICKMSLHQWKANRATLKAFFNEDWTHDKIERELGAFRAKSEANARNGGLGGAAKAANHRKSNGEAPREIFEKGVSIPEGASEAKSLTSNDAPLANATISRDRVLDKENLDKSPPSPVEPTREKEGGGDSKNWMDFKSGYTWAEWMSRLKAKSLFEALSQDDQRAAIDALPKFRTATRKQTRPTNAERYLGERIFDNYDQAAYPLVYIHKTSPEWPTHRSAYYRKWEREPKVDDKGGYWFERVPVPPPYPAASPSSAALH